MTPYEKFVGIKRAIEYHKNASLTGPSNMTVFHRQAVDYFQDAIKLIQLDVLEFIKNA